MSLIDRKITKKSDKIGIYFAFKLLFILKILIFVKSLYRIAKSMLQNVFFNETKCNVGLTKNLKSK